LLTSTSGSTISDLATNGTELAQKLSKLSDQLNEVVKNVREGKGTVGRLFNDEALYNNLNATIRDAEELANQNQERQRILPANSSMTKRLQQRQRYSLQI